VLIGERGAGEILIGKIFSREGAKARKDFKEASAAALNPIRSSAILAIGIKAAARPFSTSSRSSRLRVRIDFWRLRVSA
jgi:hypothetical protein